MKLDPHKYLVCSLRDEGRLVAIDEENQKVLAHHLAISRTLDQVPDDKTVRGIFVTVKDGFLESLDGTIQQNDITVNQLHMAATEG